MPVHTQRHGDRWQVVDDKGKVHAEHSSREKAKDQVTAMNISMGHVSGVKPKKGKK